MKAWAFPRTRKLRSHTNKKHSLDPHAVVRLHACTTVKPVAGCAGVVFGRDSPSCQALEVDLCRALILVPHLLKSVCFTLWVAAATFGAFCVASFKNLLRIHGQQTAYITRNVVLEKRELAATVEFIVLGRLYSGVAISDCTLHLASSHFMRQAVTTCGKR